MKKEIIFFDHLRFGWVVDKAIIERLNGGNDKTRDVITQKTLEDLLRKS